MKKEWWIVIILAIVLIVLGIFLYNYYSENNDLTSRINQLTGDNEQLLKDKNDLLIENKEIKDNLDMLQKDVSQIYKTCPLQNPCKGRYPGISWYCNNVGDQSDVSTASHICICTPDCQLNQTTYQNIN